MAIKDDVDVIEIEEWDMKKNGKKWTNIRLFKDCCYASVYGAYSGWFY